MRLTMSWAHKVVQKMANADTSITEISKNLHCIIFDCHSLSWYERDGIVNGLNNGRFISFDDIAFGEKRFENKEHRPHDRDWMVPTIVQRKYGNEYPICGSCGLRHDNNFIGKDYSLTEDELKYLNLNEQEKEDRKNILKYYECYLKNKDKFGLTGLGN